MIYLNFMSSNIVKERLGNGVIYENFDGMLNNVTVGAKKMLVVACAHDVHAIEAALEASRQGIVDYRLVGFGKKILEIGKEIGHEIDPDSIIDAKDDADAAQKAVKLIREQQGDFLMKGKLETATLMRAVLDKENGIRTESTMSHIAILEIPNYHKLLAVTDGGMIPYPNLEQKKMIAENAIDFFRNMGYKKPKLAIMAASETINPRMPETADAKLIKKLAENGEFGDCIVDGPLSYDLVMSRESAEIKKLISPVNCDADILLTPNVACGNMLSKCMIFTGGAKMAGCIVGAKVPIVLTSRGATAEEKHLSLLLAAASAKNR